MKDVINEHFDILVLLFMFVFASVMLALFPAREELARWLEGGLIISVIARGISDKIKPAKTTEPPADKTEGEKQ